MIDILRPTYDFALVYAQKLAADVPDEQMCAQPIEGRVMNHAAFLLGHLAWANDNVRSLLGKAPARAEYKELFGMGAKPLGDRSKYPSKVELLKALEEAHVALLADVSQATPEVLAQPSPERMRNRFPTLGHLFFGLMSSHYGTHLGQLSAWRKAMGFASVF